jgi:hypothetical protein
VLAAGHVLLVDAEAAAEDVTDSALAFALLDRGAGASVLHSAECGQLDRLVAATNFCGTQARDTIVDCRSTRSNT